MIFSRTLVLAIVAATAAGCDNSGSVSEAASNVSSAVAIGEQVVLPTADYLKLPEYKNADAGYGATLLFQCRACHSLEKDAGGTLGPNLHGLFGRPVGSVAGYPYSQALAQADFVWTPRALDAWLADPAGFMPGNRMAYAGLPNADDRNAVIAALLALNGPEEAEASDGN